MTREEIIERYEQRLAAALRGEETELDICGLSAEALRYEIMDERNHLLKQYGYDIPTSKGFRQPLR